jgi:DNA modification methylase
MVEAGRRGMNDRLQIISGDALTSLKALPESCVQTCVTSPPFWGLRDYGTATWEGGDPECDHRLNDTPAKRGLASSTPEGSKEYTAAQLQSHRDFCKRCGARRVDLQMGLESTPREYVERMVTVFREVKRVLKPEGQLWLNCGDSYVTGAGMVGDQPGGGRQGKNWRGCHEGKQGDMPPKGPLTQPNRLPVPGLKPKDLAGIPWRLAFALQEDGWWLRADIIFAKSNPMPESARDRPVKSHEYLFLLTKNGSNPLIWRSRDTMEWSYNPDLSETIVLDGVGAEEEVPRWRGFDYYYDSEAIAEPSTYAHEAKYDTGENGLHPGLIYAGSGSSTRKSTARTVPAGEHQNQRDPGTLRKIQKGTGHAKPHNGEALNANNHHWPYVTRNKRSVWTLPTQPYTEAHYATMPEELVKPCILAGSRPGDVVLDPFAGSGTTLKVALELGRKAIGIELNPQYVEIIQQRTSVTIGMF